MKMFGRLGALLSLRKTFALNLALFRDARVPLWLKIAVAAGALFTVSPLNILGDIPFLGLLDDVAMLTLLAQAFVRFAPAAVVAEHRGL